MRAILKKNDLWEYINGDKERPLNTSPELLEKWIKVDGKAESDILLIVSPSEFLASDGLSTSKEI